MAFLTTFFVARRTRHMTDEFQTAGARHSAR